ncbi:MAG: nucleoside deaminase [Planctomycetota bacterium]|nr:nucleoside deaminase [Planctomycetota bacterium]
MPTEADIRFMKRAIELGREVSLERGQAGPFGCVVVKDGEIVAEGVNRVLVDDDPTAHGEMVAIRAACRALGTHQLEGCTVYTSSEPCPMCYAACWWARVDAIFHAGTIDDAHGYGGFDDRPILDALRRPPEERPLPVTQLLRDEMLGIWREFQERDDRPHY